MKTEKKMQQILEQTWTLQKLEIPRLNDSNAGSDRSHRYCYPPEQDSHAWNVAGSACQRALAWEKAALAAGRVCWS